MTIEEAEEKLSNMHFDNIVKSYCDKVNEIELLKSDIKALKKKFRKQTLCEKRILLLSFAKSLSYNGVNIFTDYGAKKAIKEFLNTKTNERKSTT